MVRFKRYLGDNLVGLDDKLAVENEKEEGYDPKFQLWNWMNGFGTTQWSGELLKEKSLGEGMRNNGFSLDKQNLRLFKTSKKQLEQGLEHKSSVQLFLDLMNETTVERKLDFESESQRTGVAKDINL